MKLLAYGTLRAGEYNYNYMLEMFGPQAMKFIKSLEVPGYQMYSLGPYPGVVPNTEAKIYCELLEVSTEAFNYIDQMELLSGYRRVEIDGAILYVYEGDTSGLREIKSGDWLS